MTGWQTYGPRALAYLLLAGIFSVFLPWWKGLDFLDPVLLSAYACLGIVFAGPVALQTFEQRPASLAEALRWILRAAVLGEFAAVALLSIGVATVFLTHRITFFPVDLETLVYAALLGLAGSVAMAALAAWVALQFSTSVARSVVRVVLLALLALFYLDGRWLPVVVIQAIGVAAVAALAFFILLRMRLGRA